MNLVTNGSTQAVYMTLPSAIDVIDRIRGEFREMPGMRLSFDQAVRLWGLDRDTCEAVLGCLIAMGFLQRDGQGRYRKAHSGY